MGDCKHGKARDACLECERENSSHWKIRSEQFAASRQEWATRAMQAEEGNKRGSKELELYKKFFDRAVVVLNEDEDVYWGLRNAVNELKLDIEAIERARANPIQVVNLGDKNAV